MNKLLECLAKPYFAAQREDRRDERDDQRGNDYGNHRVVPPGIVRGVASGPAVIQCECAGEGRDSAELSDALSPSVES